MPTEREITYVSIFIVLCSMSYAAAVLAAVGSVDGGSGSLSSTLGWIATFGAALIFTFTTTPMKSPRLATLAIDPMLFAFFTLCGIFFVSIPLAIYLGSVSAFAYEPYGILGAFDIFIINFFAVSAVASLGVAVAPGVWAGIGMLVAFLLGTFAFSEEVRNRAYAAIALSLLAAGVYCVSTSKEQENGSSSSDHPPTQTSPSTKYALTACEAENDKVAVAIGASSIQVDGPAEEEEIVDDFEMKNNIPPPATKAAAATTTTTTTTTTETSLSVPFGILCCVMTGVCDGSLMVPFKLSTLHSGADASVYEQFNYLASFGLSAAFLAPSLFGFYTIAFRRKWPPMEHLSAATFPGIASGVIWACANLMSVTGTFLLGMNVAFPLTQTCALLSAVWGIFYFGEHVGKPIRFLCGICSVILGSYFLAASK